MKKFMSLITVIVAFALVVCLSGCAGEDSDTSGTSGTSSDISAANDAGDDSTENTANGSSNSGDSFNFELDKTVTFRNLTYSVSSDWDEIDSDSTQLYYTDDAEVNGEVGYLDLDSTLTAQEFNDTYMSDNSSRAEGKYENIISDEIENKNISGTDCTVFEYSYDDIASDKHVDGCYAYLPTEQENYVILFTSKNGTEIVEAILDTVTIE